MPRASPVSVYLFPGEAPKCGPSILQGEDTDIEGLVATATEVQADMMSDAGSEGSTDNDDFCILEAPGMGIPVSPPPFSFSSPFLNICLFFYTPILKCSLHFMTGVCT